MVELPERSQVSVGGECQRNYSTLMLSWSANGSHYQTSWNFSMVCVCVCVCVFRISVLFTKWKRDFVKSPLNFEL